MISNYIQNSPIKVLLFKMRIITYCTIIVRDMRQFLQIQMDNILYNLIKHSGNLNKS